MSDLKLTGLTEATTLNDTDLLYVVTNPSTSPESKKVKKSTIIDGLAPQSSLTSHENNLLNPHHVSLDQLYAGVLPVYSDNDTAIAGGLAIGKLYRNGDFICVVH